MHYNDHEKYEAIVAIIAAILFILFITILNNTAGAEGFVLERPMPIGDYKIHKIIISEADEYGFFSTAGEREEAHEWIVMLDDEAVTISLCPNCGGTLVYDKATGTTTYKDETCDPYEVIEEKETPKPERPEPIYVINPNEAIVGEFEPGEICFIGGWSQSMIDDGYFVSWDTLKVWEDKTYGHETWEHGIETWELQDSRTGITCFTHEVTFESNTDIDWDK